MRLAKISTRYTKNESALPFPNQLTFEDLNRLDPEEVFRKLYMKTHSSDPPQEILLVFRNLLASVIEGDSP